MKTFFVNFNYSTELKAILLAVQHHEKEMQLFNMLDSKSAINAVYRYFIKNQHPTARQIAEIIFSYMLLWIPGHSNLLGNDLADKSAKEQAVLLTPINQERITKQDLNIHLGKNSYIVATILDTNSYYQQTTIIQNPSTKMVYKCTIN